MFRNAFFPSLYFHALQNRHSLCGVQKHTSVHLFHLHRSPEQRRNLPDIRADLSLRNLQPDQVSR